MRKEKPFKVGDKVSSDFYKEESDIVRTVTYIEEDKRCGSGYRVRADGGEPCPCCKRLPGRPIGGTFDEGVDSAWFTLVQP